MVLESLAKASLGCQFGSPGLAWQVIHEPQTQENQQDYSYMSVNLPIILNACTSYVINPSEKAKLTTKTLHFLLNLGYVITASITYRKTGLEKNINEKYIIAHFILYSLK